MKFRFRKKDRPVVHPTGETTTEGDNQAQPKPNPDDHATNDAPDSVRSEESAFGIKVLVPGEAPSIE